MAKFKMIIIIESDKTETVKTVGNLLQNVVNKVDHKDLIPLMKKVVKNPDIVKTALQFI